jgi:hypothetical protein
MREKVVFCCLFTEKGNRNRRIVKNPLLLGSKRIGKSMKSNGNERKGYIPLLFKG